MTHSLEEAWALDIDHRDRLDDQFLYDHPAPHVPHSSGAISGYGPTELCLRPWICYGSYSATETRPYSALPLPGARL